MRFDLQDLPTDATMLHHLVRDMADDIAQRDEQIEQLKLIIRKLQRVQYGARSERLSEDQLALGLEDAAIDAELTAVSTPAATPKEQTTAPTSRRKALPEHLPRVDRCVDLDASACTCCGGELHPIGESVSEMLDWVPARLRVLRIRRPKYGCRACEQIHQAPAPARTMVGTLATPALQAQVVIAKYCDHTPLYRQSRIFARHGMELSRSTLAEWVAAVCWWLNALHEELCKNVFASDHLFADDTPVPVLDPGRGRTKTGRLWVYARDDRRWLGPAPPAAVYVFEPDRKAVRPRTHLEHFEDVLQVDGYAGFEQLTHRGGITLAACWAHARRKYYDVAEATASPIATEAVRRIAELYSLEDKIKYSAADERRAARERDSAPRVHALKAWLEQQLHLIRERSPLTDAIRYTLNHWTQLNRFLSDGRIELDTNPVERAIRPVALGRKNHLFAGSDGGGARWATLAR